MYKKVIFVPLLIVALVPLLKASDDDVPSSGGGASMPTTESSLARVLVSKLVQNKYLVEGKDLLIKYSFYNVGDSAAVNVVMKENGFPLEYFDLISGMTSIKIDRIPPHANNTHTLVLRPKVMGMFNFTSAEVRYQPSDDMEYVQVSYTSSPGQGYILPLKEYERQFSAHVLDWAAFAAMTLPSLCIPFLLWYSTKSKYEAIAKSKKD